MSKRKTLKRQWLEEALYKHISITLKGDINKYRTKNALDFLKVSLGRPKLKKQNVRDIICGWRNEAWEKAQNQTHIITRWSEWIGHLNSGTGDRMYVLCPGPGRFNRYRGKFFQPDSFKDFSNWMIHDNKDGFEKSVDSIGRTQDKYGMIDSSTARARELTQRLADEIERKDSASQGLILTELANNPKIYEEVIHRLPFNNKAFQVLVDKFKQEAKLYLDLKDEVEKP